MRDLWTIVGQLNNDGHSLVVDCLGLTQQPVKKIEMSNRIVIYFQPVNPNYSGY